MITIRPANALEKSIVRGLEKERKRRERQSYLAGYNVNHLHHFRGGYEPCQCGMHHLDYELIRRSFDVEECPLKAGLVHNYWSIAMRKRLGADPHWCPSDEEWVEIWKEAEDAVQEL